MRGVIVCLLLISCGGEGLVDVDVQNSPEVGLENAPQTSSVDSSQEVSEAENCTQVVETDEGLLCVFSSGEVAFIDELEE